jgi:hypothetical protein
MGDTEIVIHSKQVCERKLLELTEIEAGAVFKSAKKARASGAVLTDVQDRVMASWLEVEAAHEAALNRLCSVTVKEGLPVAPAAPLAAIAAAAPALELTPRLTAAKRQRLAEELLPIEDGYPSTGADLAVDGKAIKTLECNRDRAEELGVHIVQAYQALPADSELTDLFTDKPEMAERLLAARGHLEGGMQHLKYQSQDLMVAHLAGGNWKAATLYRGVASGKGFEKDEEKRIEKIMKMSEFQSKTKRPTVKKPYVGGGGGGGSSDQGNNRDRYNGGNNWDDRRGFPNNSRSDYQHGRQPYKKR